MEDDTCPKGSTTDEAEAATKAFDGLRKAIDTRGAATAAELKLIRQGVEALFDQVEALQAKPDLANDMAELKQTSLALAERLKTIEAMPMLKGGAQVFERAGVDLLRAAVKTLEQKAQRFDSAAFALERITRHVHDRKERLRHVMVAGGLGFVAGIFLALLGPRLLPLDLKTQVAAVILGTGSWDAGATMIPTERPEACDNGASRVASSSRWLGRKCTERPVFAKPIM